MVHLVYFSGQYRQYNVLTIKGRIEKLWRMYDKIINLYWFTWFTFPFNIDSMMYLPLKCTRTQQNMKYL